MRELLTVRESVVETVVEEGELHVGCGFVDRTHQHPENRGEMGERTERERRVRNKIREREAIRNMKIAILLFAFHKILFSSEVITGKI